MTVPRNTKNFKKSVINVIDSVGMDVFFFFYQLGAFAGSETKEQARQRIRTRSRPSSALIFNLEKSKQEPTLNTHKGHDGKSQS